MILSPNGLQTKVLPQKAKKEKKRKQWTVNAAKDGVGEEPLHTAGGSAKLVKPLWKSIWRLLKN